ncbi:MAG: hypothetical protein HY720_02835 [Planctomycetes bacterium]|nr:hypothetical protein [Planctomycetota bacterium]
MRSRRPACGIVFALATLTCLSFVVPCGAQEPAWHFADPEILFRQDAKRTLVPTGIHRVGDSLVLGVAWEGDEMGYLHTWHENADGVWEESRTAQNLELPRSFATGDRFSFLTSTAGRTTIGFFQFSAEGTPQFFNIAAFAEKSEPIWVEAVHAEGDTVHAVLHGARTEGARHSLLYTGSKERGLSWSTAKRLGEVDEGLEIVSLAADARDRLAVFVGSRSGAVLEFRSDDRGATWIRREIALDDGLPEGTRRMPVAARRSGGVEDLFYLAWREGFELRGGYYRATRTDESGTWGASRAVATDVLVVPGSAYARLEVRENLWAFLTVTGSEEYPQGRARARLYLSEDAGITWTLLPTGDYSDAEISGLALHLSAVGERILVALGFRAEPACVTLQEITRRPAPALEDLDEEERRRAGTVIDHLGQGLLFRTDWESCVRLGPDTNVNGRTEAAFSSDSRFLAFAHAGAAVIGVGEDVLQVGFRLGRGLPPWIREERGSEEIRGVAFSPEGNWFATLDQASRKPWDLGERDTLIRVWDTETWRVRRTHAVARDATGFTWTPDATGFLLGHADGRITRLSFLP